MKQRGLSMVEILVVLAIVAVALLGLLALQARAAGVQRDAFHRRQVAELVAQLAERMRANHLAVPAGLYSMRLETTDSAPSTVTSCVPPCSSSAVAARDLDEWRIELRRRVPGSAAYVQIGPSNRSAVEVAVAWPEPQAADRGDDCEALVALGAGIPARHRCYRSRVLP